MFKLYKRKGSDKFYVRITVKGRTIRESTGTADPDLAEEYAATRYAELFRQWRMGERPRWKWSDAVEQYLTEKGGKRRTRNNISMLRILDPYFDGGNMALADISGRYIAAVLDEIGKGKKPATRNRYAQLIRAILRAAAYRWEDDQGRTWIEKPPHIEILPEDNARDRWLTREEACRLVAELPPHLGDMVCLALYTGLREANITRMEWSWVDLDRRVVVIPREHAKARKPIPVYLVPEAYAVIQDQVGRHPRWVFTWRGQRVTRINNSAWRKARIRAGLEDVRVHDLRRTWASWHLQAGTSMDDLMRIGGWASPELVRERYAHLAPEQLREIAENIRPTLAVVHKSGTE